MKIDKTMVITASITLVALAAGSTFFYWFGYRPTAVKKSCALKAEAEANEYSMISINAGTLVTQSKHDEVVNRSYNDCLRLNGL